MSRATLGNAADKILRGEIDRAELEAAIAGCYWCRLALPTLDCWHQDARRLLDCGLQSESGRRPDAQLTLGCEETT